MSENPIERRKRISHFNRAISFAEGDPEFESVERLFQDSAGKARVKHALRKAESIAAAMNANGPHLYIDTLIRRFLLEYNARVFRGDGTSQPSSFNVISGFLTPDDTCLVLKLLEEKFYQFDLREYLDYVTSPTNAGAPNLADVSEDLVVYEFNQIGLPVRIDLPDIDQIYFAGIAFCREGDAVYVCGLFGEKPEGVPSGTIPLGEGEMAPGRQHMDGDYDANPEDFFSIDGYSPLIALMELDLKELTYTSRYVLRERKGLYFIHMDDPSVHEVVSQSFPSFKNETYEKQKEKLRDYVGVFELMTHALKLPTYFRERDDDITVQRHPTDLRTSSSAKLKRKVELADSKDRPMYREVHTLPAGAGASRSFNLENVGLRRETQGYWRRLENGAIGTSKSGTQIVGKTWVTKDLSWVEFAEQPVSGSTKVTVEDSEGADAGFIYVMKSPSHRSHTYKIGWTRADPERRAEELSASTGQPDKFVVIQSWSVRSPRRVEQEVHRRLHAQRLSSAREFFQARFEIIRETIEDAIATLGLAP